MKRRDYEVDISKRLQMNLPTLFDIDITYIDMVIIFDFENFMFQTPLEKFSYNDIRNKLEKDL